METVFLVCFVFGALFAGISVLLGVAHVGLPHAHGGAAHVGGHVGHMGHAGHVPHVPHGGHAVHGAAQDGSAPPADQGGIGAAVSHFALPLFNASSALAFLTWFGAAGYLLLHVAGWTLLWALVLAGAAGLVAAVLVALFLRQMLAGTRIMDPRDYRMEGTLAHVTVTIPDDGVGEIVFSKGGRRRSEAARGDRGQAVARGTEVVVMRYEAGVAHVQPWTELVQGDSLAPAAPEGASPTGASPTGASPTGASPTGASPTGASPTAAAPAALPAARVRAAANPAGPPHEGSAPT